jgi:hypothetical protein
VFVGAGTEVAVGGTCPGTGVAGVVGVGVTGIGVALPETAVAPAVAPAVGVRLAMALTRRSFTSA